MKNKIILITFIITIIGTCSCYCQPHTSVIFSYDILQYNSLKYKFISQDKFILQCKNEFQSNDSISNYKEHIYIIDSSLNIKYIRYIQRRFSEDTNHLFKRDKIEILGTSVNLDSLFYGEDYTKTIEPRASTINGVYKFNFLNHKYVCFYIQDITNPESMLNTDILLFDITNLYKIKLLLHAFQASEDLKCFGDFNKNGKLDFVLWSYGNSFQDTLKLYELDSNMSEFTLIKNKYLIITDTGSTYNVNLKKSKWFANSPIYKKLSKNKP